MSEAQHQHTDVPASGRHESNRPPRTLADELRARDDVSLVALLRSRADLLSPVPADVTQLATRAGTRASVVRAVERLDTFTLQTAEALAISPDPLSTDTLHTLMPGEEAAAELPGALHRLREQALLWGPDDKLRLVRTVRELLGPNRPGQGGSPTGLGPTLAEAVAGMSPGRLQEILGHVGLPGTHDPVSALDALSTVFTDRAAMDALLSQGPPESHEILRRLQWGPPYGSVDGRASVGRRHVDDESGLSAPIRWLLDRALLVRSGPATVVLPREVALHLRGGRAHRVLQPRPPELAPRRAHSLSSVDGAAAGQAWAACAVVEDLLTSWESEPPTVLRAGGLGVRDLKRTAHALELAEPITVFWIELAYAAGLLALDGEEDERYAPTPAYDEWLAKPSHQRWEQLVEAWWDATRLPGLVGERDSKGRGYTALGPGLDRGFAPEIRHRTLALLAEPEAGTALEPESVQARVDWEKPLRGGASGELRQSIVDWTLREAELLGVTGRGALASFARPLATEDQGPQHATATAAEALAPHLPEPLAHILLQADLTAVAPGPLEHGLAAVLGTLADVESKGGATVYRFSPASVRRGLDAGYDAADIHRFLTDHSRTPVPQPLSYLIDDVARRHGSLRVGSASSYVRCDDDTLLAEILADRRTEPLRLRQLAPTVLASSAAPEQLLTRLREMGYAPAAESATGDVVVARPERWRTPARTAPDPVPDGPPTPDNQLLKAAVRAVRAGDHAAVADPEDPPSTRYRNRRACAEGRALPRTTSAETLAALQAAALSEDEVWIGYVNADGAASQRLIAPVRVEGGFVTGYDHAAEEVRTYPLHRITGVAALTDE